MASTIRARGSPIACGLAAIASDDGFDGRIATAAGGAVNNSISTSVAAWPLRYL
ncbi:hypothetical protein J2W32_005401 [Variovorax boronicumulans]|uniref:Uncharacterized protein n=1 Tax=Variovorax boronicumulans TaxID=436515 RepID=A0AAW8D5K1_9BURK|nr:hypothetical protein [Variovorax boronicumulans]MDP9896357.1 hypothetical protein [Variovorax boronicumulans]MDP9995680.1 hypothetical protein [Variovorax boronicumulans]MDQ0006855.1 hypothetical protein [Variovorax boronicumulans]MDQ0036777.1 hypothetical protein [Variovorax boronicumulans]MDQ0056333.1 hypothetical protein [Variovorax boronicumulans]